MGKPLSIYLLSRGYKVRGTTTRSEKKKELEAFGIATTIIKLTSDGFDGPISEFLKGLDVLIFNIPPGLRKQPQSDFVGKVNHLLIALRQIPVPRLIYISSTSVYGRLQGRVDESILPLPDTPAGKQLLEAENLIWQDRIARATLIIRLGGLLGPRRHPVITLSGKSDLSGGSDPVNLIHQEQAIQIIHMALERTGWEGLLNAVHPDHPIKAVFYTEEARRMGLAPPIYHKGEKPMPAKQVLSQFAPELRYIFKDRL
ncbi:MAG: hypothetical protein RLZZ241_998 [Bacteroidota bacterium]